MSKLPALLFAIAAVIAFMHGNVDSAVMWAGASVLSAIVIK